MSDAPRLEPAVEKILETRRRVSGQRSALVAVSGIDASGKGYITNEVAAALRALGMRIATINIDGWLNLPHVRFSKNNRAEHFYLNAIRFEDMFTQLVFPLRDRRSLKVEMEFVEETAMHYRKQVCEFENIDVILLEGIYLLKRSFQNYYDLSVWIDCSFETALERAIARAQEGLPAGETIRAYQSIYFPAQKIHFTRDRPTQAATIIVNNDLSYLAAKWI